MKPYLAALSGLALLSLTNCGEQISAATPVSYCPNVAVLQQASAMNSYLPGHSDPASETASFRITGVAGSCASIEDGNAVATRLRVGFAATRGPAGGPSTVTLPYFVSISQGNMLFWKASHLITLNFNDSTNTAIAVSEELLVRLPNTIPTASTDVLVGFQLTPEQSAPPTN